MRLMLRLIAIKKINRSAALLFKQRRRWLWARVRYRILVASCIRDRRRINAANYSGWHLCCRRTYAVVLLFAWLSLLSLVVDQPVLTTAPPASHRDIDVRTDRRTDRQDP